MSQPVTVRETGKASTPRKAVPPSKLTTAAFEVPDPAEPRAVATLNPRTKLDRFIAALDSVPCLTPLLERTGYPVVSIDGRGPGVVGFRCPKCGTSVISASGHPNVRLTSGRYGTDLQPQRLVCLVCRWDATASTVAPIVLGGDAV